jgi:hypothetical protein
MSFILYYLCSVSYNCITFFLLSPLLIYFFTNLIIFFLTSESVVKESTESFELIFSVYYLRGWFRTLAERSKTTARLVSHSRQAVENERFTKNLYLSL